MNSILPLLLLTTTMTHASQPSGCQECASTGQCNAAFHNGPGQYCGSFYDVSTSGNKPCCCPPQATCKVSPTQCMCHVSDRQPSPSNTDYHPSSHTSVNYNPHSQHHETSPSAPGLAPFIFIIIIFCCCVFCFRRREEDHDAHHHCHTSSSASSEYIPVAMAVPATCPPSENPDYQTHNYGSTMYGNPPPPSGGGGGAGTAIASGLGGLAVGTVLGDLIGRNSARANNPQQQFGGGNGGYDIVGDSGGGYDIAGDSGDNGGGGYDIAGDSGDGGYDSGDGGYDIAGDS